jgi:soluble lytic murein transglycosylase-like protein
MQPRARTLALAVGAILLPGAAIAAATAPPRGGPAIVVRNHPHHGPHVARAGGGRVAAGFVRARRTPAFAPARELAAVSHATPSSVSLPVASPWALPPLILVHARAGGGNRAALGRQLLTHHEIALAPAARRAVRNQQVDPGLLRLLMRTRRTGGPLLVFAASGRDARVQETTLWMTRRVLGGYHLLPRLARPASLLLTPVPGTKADLKGPPKPTAGELPSLVALYRAAGYRYGVDWRILAAINRVETGYGTNTHVSSAGAVGWMQFLPSTWRRWGVDASGDGVADPMNPADAIYSAARYLQAAGIQHDVRRAIWAYNPLASYVNMVLSIAAGFPEDYGAPAVTTTG